MDRRVLAGAIAWGLILGCGHTQRSEQAGPAGPALRVQAEKVQQAQVPMLVTAVGTTQAYNRVMPGTRLMGRVAEVGFTEGDRVGKGAILARLESQDLKARQRQAQAALQEAQTVLAQAERDLSRSRNLQQEQALTQQALEEAETAQARARAAASAAAERLEELKAELRYTVVVSPVAGVLVEKRVEVGDMAVPGAPMFAVEQQDPIKVVVELSERELRQVRVGQEVEVEIEAADQEGRPGRQGRVEALIPAADPHSRTFQAQVVLPNPDHAIVSGLFARVRFPREGRPALLVPRTAVVRQGQLEGVYVVVESRARLRWVRLGKEWGERVEVLSGLAAGDQVVSAPEPGLRDGAAVEMSGDA